MRDSVVLGERKSLSSPLFQERLLEAVAETSLDGVLVVDNDGQMTYFNQRFIEMWRIPADVAASGRHDAAIQAVRSQVVDPDAFTARIEHLRENTLEKSNDTLRLRDGRIVERYSAPVLSDAGTPAGRVWFFRDVSDSESGIAASELLAMSGELFGTSLEVETTLTQLVNLVVPRIADWAAVDVLDANDLFQRVGVAHVDPKGAQLLRELHDRYPLRANEGRLRGRVVATLEPIALYDVDEGELRSLSRDEEHFQMLKALGIRSAMWVPLIVRERVVGVLSAGYRDASRRYAATDLQLLRELARRAALAVDNALLYRAVQRAATLQAALAALGQEALAGAPFEDVAQKASVSLASIMNVPYVEVLRLRADNELFLAAGVGWRPGTVGTATVGAGQGSQGGYTLATVGPVVVDDLTTETRFRPPTLLSDHGVVSGVTVVIGSPTSPHGVLGAHTDSHRIFVQDDVNFLQAVANVLATAVERQQSDDRQATLAALGQSALLGVPYGELAQDAAARLARIMGVPFVEVLQLEPDRTVLRLIAGVGWEDGLVGTATVKAGLGSQGGYTLATVGPVVVREMATESRFRPPALLADAGVVSGLTVVIGSSAAPYGVLGTHADHHRAFAEDDVNFLQAVANVLAAALEQQLNEDRLNNLATAEQSRAAQLRAMIESIGDPVVVCDVKGDVVLANPAAEALLGERLQDGLSGILSTFEWPSRGGVEELDPGEPIELRRAGRPIATGPDTPPDATADELWVELSVFPVIGDREDVSASGGTVLVLRDVTVARNARTVREAFLGILSHELRTPVTTIYGGAEMLARRASSVSDGQRQDVYEDIRSEADRLYRLVENLLVLSRVERQGLEIDAEPVLLQRLIPRVIEAESSRWLGATFVPELSSGLPPVAAEETYLEQVLRNLLGNAAKYGGDGPVSVTAADVGKFVRVTISDSGPGFHVDETERLFELFYRSPSLARTAAGAGIGLFVSRQLVHAMGGRIWARNRTDGQGAEFGFEVPVFAD
jgi:signal transduction histidine kinase